MLLNPITDRFYTQVLEETGYDLTKQINPNDCIEMVIKDQRVALFVVPNVPEDFPFQTRTRKEISVRIHLYLVWLFTGVFTIAYCRKSSGSTWEICPLGRGINRLRGNFISFPPLFRRSSYLSGFSYSTNNFYQPFERIHPGQQGE